MAPPSHLLNALCIQGFTYNWCIQKYSASHRWLGFIDIDEVGLGPVECSKLVCTPACEPG